MNVTKKCTLPRERHKPPNEKSEFGSEAPQSWDLGSISTAPTKSLETKNFANAKSANQC